MDTTFDAYRDKTLLLVQSMVIKHQHHATAINNKLRRLGYRIDSDPRTWKYYLNIAGIYHAYDKDLLLSKSDQQSEYMQIKVASDEGPVSADFVKEMFNGENADPAMANEYKYGTQYHTELINKYPEFLTLIQGILNPIDVSLSTTSYDGDILLIGDYIKDINVLNGKPYFRKINPSVFDIDDLIEDHEADIIYDIQQWIYLFLKRWINHEYVPIEDLYFPTKWGTMVSCLIGAIMNIRLSQIKTNKACTFHIKSYLDSRNGLGQYVANLNIKEILWLYRNIDWLSLHHGETKTFEMILNNILTPSGIPLSAYELIHDNDKIHDDERPLIQARSVGLNFNPQNVVGTRRYSIKEVIEAQEAIAPYNAKDLDQDAHRIELTGSRATRSHLKTKVLESGLIDLTNYIPYQLEDVLANYWAYSVARGTYKGTAFFTHPRTKERLQFTMLNTLVLLIYAYNKGQYDIDLEKIPPVYVRGIFRETNRTLNPNFRVRPTFAELRSKIDRVSFPDQELAKAMGRFTPIYEHRNSTEFFEHVSDAWDELNRQYRYSEDCPYINRSAYRNWASRNTQWNGMEVDLPNTGRNYSDWFSSMNLNPSDFERVDWLNLMTELFLYGTGFRENVNRSLRNVQRACLSILSAFSSYSTHVINDSETYLPVHNGSSGDKFDDYGVVDLSVINVVSDESNYTIMGERISSVYPTEFYGAPNNEDLSERSLTTYENPNVLGSYAIKSIQEPIFMDIHCADYILLDE